MLPLPSSWTLITRSLSSASPAAVCCFCAMHLRSRLPAESHHRPAPLTPLHPYLALCCSLPCGWFWISYGTSAPGLNYAAPQILSHGVLSGLAGIRPEQGTREEELVMEWARRHRCCGRGIASQLDEPQRRKRRKRRRQVCSIQRRSPQQRVGVAARVRRVRGG